MINADTVVQVLQAVRDRGLRAIIHTDWCELNLGGVTLPPNVFIYVSTNSGFAQMFAKLPVIR